jgi:chromosome segregation ATPase
MSLPKLRPLVQGDSVKDKAPIIVLVLVAVGLAIGLIVVNNKASLQKKEADDSIRSLSNIVISTKATLAEYQSVNQTLETNLAATKAEASNKLSLSEANLHSTEAELEKARAEAKAQAEADAAAVAQRDKKISDLQNQNVDLDKKAADLRATIATLDTQIADTKKKLAESQGDRTLLLAELKRLQARQAELERKFHDLAALRLEIRKLKEEATLARQLDWMRRGVYASFGEKGAELLMKHGAEPPPPATNAQLNVEIHQSGTIKITPTTPTNSLAPTNPPAK